jgi:hypothetical protein
MVVIKDFLLQLRPQSVPYDRTGSKEERKWTRK